MARARSAPGSSLPEARLSPIGLYVLPGLVLFLAAAVRCTTLSFQGLWLDEISTVVEAGRPWPGLLLALLDPRQGYPLYILGMRLWIALFGSGEAALRWPSALAGVLNVPLLYLLGQRLYSRRAGLLAALFLAISPLAVWYSQEAKAYAFFMLFGTLAWLLFWEAIERRRAGLWWVFGALTALNLLLHRLAILALIGQLAYALYLARQGRFTRRNRLLLVLLLAAVLLLTLAGLWFALGQEGASRQFGAERDPMTLLRTFSQFSLRIGPTAPEPALGPDRRAWLIPFALAMLLGLAGLAEDALAGARRRRRAAFLCCALFVPLGAFFLLYLIRPFYYERYLLGTLPPYLLLLAAGVTALWRWAVQRNRRWPWAWTLGLPAIVLVLLMLSSSWRQVQDWTLSPRPSKEQYREATLYLQQHLHPGDLVIVHPGYTLPAVDFYQARLPAVPLDARTIPDLLAPDYGFRDFEATMEALSRGHRRAWLYLAPFHAAFQDPRNWVYEWFYLNPFLPCDEQHYVGLDLYCISFNVVRGSNTLSPTLPLDGRFGQEVHLRGADVGRFFPDSCQPDPSEAPLLLSRHDGSPFFQALPGGVPLAVTLYAQGVRARLPDIDAVVRLVGEGSHLWAETSGQPLGGHLPTPRWLPGDEFMDYHVLWLPESLPAGTYRVQVGYRLAGGEMVRAVLALLPGRCQGPAGEGLASGGCPLLLPDRSPWLTLGTIEVAAPGGPP